MIKVNCDRCGAEMDPTGEIGKIRWQIFDGMLGKNKLDELGEDVYCERCMDEVMAVIQSPALKKEYETPVIEEVKKPRKRRSDIEDETAEKIIKLYKQGMNSRQIARELKMDGRKVENWIYYKKNHGGI